MVTDISYVLVIVNVTDFACSWCADNGIFIVTDMSYGLVMVNVSGIGCS